MVTPVPADALAGATAVPATTAADTAVWVSLPTAAADAALALVRAEACETTTEGSATGVEEELDVSSLGDVTLKVPESFGVLFESSLEMALSGGVSSVVGLGALGAVEASATVLVIVAATAESSAPSADGGITGMEVTAVAMVVVVVVLGD